MVEKRFANWASCSADIFNGIHANTQIPKIAGLARLYEVEGDEKARTGAEYFFTEVSTKRSYANGGHSESEHAA